MRALLFSLSLIAILAVGCEEPTASNEPAAPATKPTYAELDMVDAAKLETALAANAVTLVDFTADW